MSALHAFFTGAGLVRLLSYLRTLHACAEVESASFEHYFDTLVPKDLDWDALAQVEGSRRMYLGMELGGNFKTRAGYKRTVQRDFDSLRKDIRARFTHGILAYGDQSYDEEAIRTLASNFSRSTGRVLEPLDVARFLHAIPILHQTTKDIGMSAEIRCIDDQHGIPSVVLTATYCGTILRICQLVVRTTCFVDAPDSLSIRAPLDDSELSRHGRMLRNLVGIWMTGEPDDPEVHAASRAVANARGAPALAAEGQAIGCLKYGWSLFEALHEFAHILKGDWLRPSSSWSAETESAADRFAVACILLEANPFFRVWYLRGALLFLWTLALAEQRYAKGGPHPSALSRATALTTFALSRLHGDEIERFALLHRLNAVHEFCIRSNVATDTQC